MTPDMFHLQPCHVPPRHRPPATDAAATHRNSNDNVRQRKGNYAEPGASTWAVCEKRLGKAAVLPRIYPYHWCKDDPKSITSQLYVPGPGLGLGTHSWTAVLNPQRGTNRKFENRIHTWVTLEGFGWINELSGSLSTCWGSAILYQLVSF